MNKCFGAHNLIYVSHSLYESVQICLAFHFYHFFILIMPPDAINKLNKF
jgi:hypothetical protein